MTALECAFALLKCSPIGNPENSSEYGRVAYILSEHCQGKEDVSEAAMRIFAERIAELERERDEARNSSEAFSALAWKLEGERNELREKAERYRIEANSLILQRDEAREKYDNLATEHMLAINKICNERDEARELAQQLVHIASHCLGWHDNTNPETITEAINRWNAATKK